MVSSIQKKQQEKQNQSSSTSDSSNIMGFLYSLVAWIIIIVFSIVTYNGFTTAYFNFNNETDLPTDIHNLPYALPSTKTKLKHAAKRLARVGKHLGSNLLSKGKSRLAGTKLGSRINKYGEKANTHLTKLKNTANELNKVSMQRGGGCTESDIGYFYRKSGNAVSDWISDILIYSWSSLRNDICLMLPTKKENKSLSKLSYGVKALIFIFIPILLILGMKLVGLIGIFRTAWGSFAVLPDIISAMVVFFFTIFPFPIMAPVIGVISLVVGFLQAFWSFYFLGIKGFNASPSGIFKKTAKEFVNIITIILALGMMTSSSHLSSGAAQGVNIAGIILIILSAGHMGHKMYKQRKH